MSPVATKSRTKEDAKQIIEKSKRIAQEAGVLVAREGSKKSNILGEVYQYVRFNFKVTYSNLDLTASHPASRGIAESIQIEYNNRLVFDVLISPGGTEVSRFDDKNDWKE